MHSSSHIHANRLRELFRELEFIYPDYKKHFRLEKFGKGSFLLQEGTVCNHFWIVEQGILRCFHRRDTSEVVTYFWFPEDFVFSTRSYLLQEPCRDNIQALSDITVYAVSRKDFEELCSKFPIIRDIRDVMVEMHTMWLEERLLSMQCCSASERYMQLLEEEPQLIQQIPLTHIASYLGITIETLSRIRNKWSKRTTAK
jgi:CRP-like cAMP-binding protein